MPTECSPDLFEFARVEGCAVVAAFDGGRITSDAGALLLGSADRVIGLTRKLAACFKDVRNAAFVEHQVETLVMQRVVGIALGYEDLNDHDELRHDPVLAALAGKLAARRSDCAPLAGKSTLNRLELSRSEPTRYAKLAADTAAIERLFVDVFLDAHDRAPEQIILDLDATEQRVRLFGIPTDAGELAKHHVLSAADLALVCARRCPGNRLGFAVELCAMRYPGRAARSRGSAALGHAGVCRQPAGRRSKAVRRLCARREHVLDLQAVLGLRSFRLADWRACPLAGADAAWATDRGEPIMRAMLTRLRSDRVLIPAAAVLERIGLAARVRARKRVFEVLAEGLTDARRGGARKRC